MSAFHNAWHSMKGYTKSPIELNESVKCVVVRGQMLTLRSEDISLNINLDFEENFPFQKDVLSKTSQRPDRSFFRSLKN